MADIFGMLIILCLVLVISQCANSERTLLESMTNGNANANANTNSNANANANANVPLANVAPNANSGLKARRKPLNSNNNVFKYYPGEILNADANAPYGFKVPPSMQQEHTLLKDMGVSNDSAMSQKEVTSGYAKFLPTDSQYPGFDPSSKGGLLKEQQGKHVKTAQAVANYLPRNINGNSNSQVMAANSNEIMSNAGVASNRNVKKPDDSLINSNSIGLSNRNSKGVKGINLHLIYAPWCGHSRNMLEDYDAVIADYNGKTKDGVTYEVIKIDMEKDKDAAKRYEVEVKGFPTLYTFYAVGDKKISNVFPYRTKDKIIEELEKRGMAMK